MNHIAGKLNSKFQSRKAISFESSSFLGQKQVVFLREWSGSLYPTIVGLRSMLLAHSTTTIVCMRPVRSQLEPLTPYIMPGDQPSVLLTNTTYLVAAFRLGARRTGSSCPIFDRQPCTTFKNNYKDPTLNSATESRLNICGLLK